MDPKFRKFLEEMDAEEEKKTAGQPDIISWAKANTSNDVETYRIDLEKVVRWLETHLSPLHTAPRKKTAARKARKKRR